MAVRDGEHLSLSKILRWSNLKTPIVDRLYVRWWEMLCDVIILWQLCWKCCGTISSPRRGVVPCFVIAKVLSDMSCQRLRMLIFPRQPLDADYPKTLKCKIRMDIFRILCMHVILCSRVTGFAVEIPVATIYKCFDVRAPDYWIYTFKRYSNTTFTFVWNWEWVWGEKWHFTQIQLKYWALRWCT